MKVLFVEPVSFPTHYDYNTGILRNFPDNVEVDICALHGYIKKTDINYSRYYCIPEKMMYRYSIKDKHPQINLRWKLLNVWLWIKKNVDFSDYDIILFAYTEAITFSIIMNNIKQKVLYIDHEIGSTVANKLKLYFFKHINPQYKFIAFEDYIKSYLKKIKGFKNDVTVIRFPLPKTDEIENNICINDNERSNTNFFIFAPAINNDEEFVQFLVDNKERISKNIKIEIKSKLISVNSDNLLVFCDRIANEQYKDNLRRCNAILINYGRNYNFRTSAVFFEAVRYKKPVILCINNTLKYYAQKYNEMVWSFNDFEEFLSKQDELCEFMRKTSSKSFENVMNDYTDDVVTKGILKALEL